VSPSPKKDFDFSFRRIKMVTQSINSLMSAAQPFSATQSILDGQLGGIQYNGDMSGDLWKPTNEMGKDQFLMLLMTQLKYQDPLSPMENSDFVAQLAQFRALETGENTERAIRDLNEAFSMNLEAQMYASSSIANSSAMALIGKEVRMRQVTVNFDGTPNTNIPIRVHLGNAHNGVVEIRNAEGEIIRTLSVNDKDATNSGIVYWNGKMDNGQTARAGNYLVGVRGQENNPSLYTFVQSVVEGVRFTADGVLVKIDGREISIGEVLDVSMNEDGGYMSQSSALSLMGKSVRARHDSIRHSATEGAEHMIMVNGPSNQQINVEIKNGAGATVAIMRVHTNDSGHAQMFWDGYTINGTMAPAGEYKIHVEGSDKNSSIYSYVEGIVDGLTSLTGDFKLKMGNAEIAVSNILSISTPRT